MEKRLTTPITPEEIDALNVGDMVLISGFVFTGRDAVLPKVCSLLENSSSSKTIIDLEGGVIFHTAVSPAGVGPTSSNKVEIESSIPALSQSGIRVHLGKGAISRSTIDEISKNHACFAVIPPVSALLAEKTISKELIAFPELGMEAFYRLKVQDYPAIIAAVNGKSIFG